MVGLAAGPLLGCVSGPRTALENLDVVIKGGVIYDGVNDGGVSADVGVLGDRVRAIGDLNGVTAKTTVDATGLVVAPGFINMLSWAGDSLLSDGRALSDVSQGITLNVLGEGWSMGPLNEAMAAAGGSSDLYAVRNPPTWRTLGDYLQRVEENGASVNVASFVGAMTLRINVMGRDNRAPTSAELARMTQLADEAMREGAMGLGCALIYAPNSYAQTDELVALSRAVGPHGGAYIAHMRSEADRLLEALEETIQIAREAGVRAQVHHLKAAGRANWPKMRAAIDRIESARAAGLDISANMYPYTAGQTFLQGCLPTWVQSGDNWVSRLREPATRARVEREMTLPGADWENLFLAAGPEGVVPLAFAAPHLLRFANRSIAVIATERGASPQATIIDLILENGSPIFAAYHLMSEDNVRLGLAQDWVSLCTDEPAVAPDGPLREDSVHPRAYGAFPRFLGRYVRDQGTASLGAAVRRLSGAPARFLRLPDRGRLAAGAFADIVVFDAAAISDHATFQNPHQLSTGVRHVFVNGAPVIREGRHTGARPGRAVRGPGWSAA